MGQYGNQPDFGTTVDILDTVGIDKTFPPSAVYIGITNDGLKTEITAIPVGNNGVAVNINGIQPGTFLPFVVVKITAIGNNLSRQDVLLYR